MAHNSRPTADAVIPRYIICIMVGVVDGNCILREENPKPASIAAIPKNNRFHLVTRDGVVETNEIVEFLLPDLQSLDLELSQSHVFIC